MGWSLRKLGRHDKREEKLEVAQFSQNSHKLSQGYTRLGCCPVQLTKDVRQNQTDHTWENQVEIRSLLATHT